MNFQEAKKQVPNANVRIMLRPNRDGSSDEEPKPGSGPILIAAVVCGATILILFLLTVVFRILRRRNPSRPTVRFGQASYLVKENVDRVRRRVTLKNVKSITFDRFSDRQIHNPSRCLRRHSTWNSTNYGEFDMLNRTQQSHSLNPIFMNRKV